MSSSESSWPRALPARFVPDPLSRRRRTGAETPPPPQAEPEPPRTRSADEDREALEVACREAYERGVEEGRAALPWREAEQVTSAADALGDAARALVALRDDYLRANRRGLAELAVAIAERILAREVELDPDALAPVLERALGRLGERETLRLRLSAEDRSTLEAGLAPALGRLRREAGLEISVDASLSRGDMRLESGSALVDVRHAELLARLREELAAVLGSGERS